MKKIAGSKTKKGADGKNYILNTANMRAFLLSSVSTQPVITKHADGSPLTRSEFDGARLSGFQGIIIMKASSPKSYGAS